MPVLHLPTSLPELMILGLLLAGFGGFALTLLTVSISVTLAQRAADEPVEREVVPARRAETAPASGG